jgi:hypothetical protein
VEAQELKRSRRRVNKFDFDSLDNEEQRMVQQAIRNSQKEVRRSTCAIPEAPTYYPTLKEFENPIDYISR